MLLIPNGPRFADGETVQLDTSDRNRIGSGGESAVYRFTHPELGELAAKIWKTNDAVRATKAGYLTWNPPAIGAPNLVAAPCAVLQDANQNAVGYLMPMLETVRWQPVIVCYNQAAAATAGMANQYGWQDEDAARRLRTQWAANLANVMKDVHLHGYRIGDLKESNVMVSPEGAVALLDCDSWQPPFADNDSRWNCPVGRAEYTPPEILEILSHNCWQPGCAGEPTHRAAHACVQRNTQHDAFALAALIFRILMAGEDPFGQHPAKAGQPGHLPREDNYAANRIKAGLFRYGTKHRKCCGPRDEASAERWEQLTPQVREMMERALNRPRTTTLTEPPLPSINYTTASNRPEPLEWVSAILQSENEAANREAKQSTETPETTPTEENATESQPATKTPLVSFGLLAVMIVGLANTCAVAMAAAGFSSVAFGMTFSASLCACAAIVIGSNKSTDERYPTKKELIYLMSAAIGIAMVTAAVTVPTGKLAVMGGAAAGSCTTILLALGIFQRNTETPQQTRQSNNSNRAT